ncbi:MAG: helix-turn-helix transcriptional regulator [Bacteroidales bacterium]|nr:helix-turn-helix transcriptional regulator [Bacteroidales bacterium]
MKKCRYTILLTAAVAVLSLTVSCSKPDRSEEATQLKYELQDLLFSAPEQVLARVDSAERVGVFSETTANLIRSNVYAQMGKTQLAIFYGEQIKHSPLLRSEGVNYYSALLNLISLLNKSGEWGKALHLADEMIADVDKGGMDEQVALRIKSRALTIKGDCEKDMGHMEEAERYYLEGLDLMMDGVIHPDSYWVIDALFMAVLETTEFYLEWGKPQKALPLVAKGDTTLARMARCPDMPERVLNVRNNNLTINQALTYAANGLYDKAELLYEKHRQAPDLTPYDLVAEARYLTIIGRYDEAIRLFRKTDSLYIARGSSINNSYINNYMMSQYKALKKAGRTDEAMVYADRMRHLSDSIHREERKMEMEQQEVIRQKEAEITSRRHSLAVHRIILFSAIIIILLVGYLLVRAWKYNKALEAKNRSLYQEIQQKEKAEADERAALQERQADTLSQSELLYRRLCEIMSSPDVFTNPDTNQDTLATLAGTNRTYVYDALRECAGVTPTDFINGYRLRYAARLLATTSDSVALIAELCGLSRRTFYRLFDEAYSMSPSEYRKAAKK